MLYVRVVVSQDKRLYGVLCPSFLRIQLTGFIMLFWYVVNLAAEYPGFIPL